MLHYKLPITMILFLLISILAMKLLELANMGKSSRLSGFILRYNNRRLAITDAMKTTAAIVLRKLFLKRVP